MFHPHALLFFLASVAHVPGRRPRLGLAFTLSYGQLTRACVKLAVKFTDLVLSEFARELLLFSSTRFHDYWHCATASLEDKGSLKRVLDTLAMTINVGLTRFLSNYRQWKRFLTAFGAPLLPPYFDLPDDQLLAYSTLPLPVENPYIKQHAAEDPPYRTLTESSDGWTPV